LLGRCIGQMSYREVSVIEVREMLRLWLAGRGLREVARLSGMDRKTVRRYVDRARATSLGSSVASNMRGRISLLEKTFEI